MPVIILFLLFLSSHYKFDFNRNLVTISEKLHTKCLDLSKTKSKYNSLFQSFLCGKKLEDDTHRDALIKAGIYHLIVVSAGHFIFIESILIFFKFPYVLRLFFLFVYYLVSHLQAPALRSLAQVVFKNFFSTFSYKISSLNSTLMSGLSCLILCSSYWHSLSFWLSFSVSIALTITSDLFYRENPVNKTLIQACIIYVILFPFLYQNSYTHPLIIFIGIILAMPSFFILLVSFLIHFLNQYLQTTWIEHFFDIILDKYFYFLKLITQFAQEKNQNSLNNNFLWVYLFALCIGFHFLKIKLERHTNVG